MSKHKAATVLIVDEDQDARELFSFDLRMAGFQTLMATNEARAWEILNKRNIDVVLMDTSKVEEGKSFLMERIEHMAGKRPHILSSQVLFMDPAEGQYIPRLQHLLNEKEKLTTIVEDIAQLSQQDRARHPKRNESRVTVHVALEGCDHLHRLQTENLSRSGMYVRSQALRPRVGDKVRFVITSDDNDWLPVCGSGQVKWTRPHNDTHGNPGFGVQFSDCRMLSQGRFMKAHA